jgi:hypothetical protein
VEEDYHDGKRRRRRRNQWRMRSIRQCLSLDVYSVVMLICYNFCDTPVNCWAESDFKDEVLSV